MTREIDWLAEAEMAKKMHKPKTRVANVIYMEELYRPIKLPPYTMSTEEQFNLL